MTKRVYVVAEARATCSDCEWGYSSGAFPSDKKLATLNVNAGKHSARKGHSVQVLTRKVYRSSKVA